MQCIYRKKRNRTLAGSVTACLCHLMGKIRSNKDSNLKFQIRISTPRPGQDNVHNSISYNRLRFKLVEYPSKTMRFGKGDIRLQ